MPITFPTNPTDNQEFTHNGRTYTYSASRGVWLGSRGGGFGTVGGGSSSITVSDSAPANPSEGDLWFHSTLLETYVYYSSQWVLSNPSGSSSSGGGGVTTYATAAELPLTGNSNGDMAFVEETDRLYLSNDNGWFNIALINTTPTITSGSAGSYALATDGTPTVITLVANDPEEVPLTWTYSVTSGSLGTTATVSQADNVFTITPGTDEANDGGTFQLTFSVTDGTNIVNDVSSFTLNFVTAIENSAYTVALVTANNLSGTIDDASYSNNTINTVGSPELTTFSPYRPGGYSLQLDGNDYITPGFNDNFGTGDFTFECWVKTTVGGIIMGQYDGGSQMEAFEILTTTGAMASHTDSGTEGAAGTKDLRDNQWHHLVWERHSGTYYYYADGVLQDSRANTENGTQSSGWYIGRHGTANTGYYTGEIRDLKFTAGTAVYGGTTPSVPTETTISGTETFVFATGLPYEKDLSTSGSTRTITNYGDPKYVPGNPYDYDTFDPAVHGGSIYFNGAGASGDSVWVGNNTILSSLTDWTLDWWMYPTSITHNTPNYSTVFSASLNGTVGNDLTDIYIDGTNMALYYYSQGAARLNTGANSINLNQWHHVAISRTGSNMTLFLNGKAVDTDNAPTNPVDSYAPYIGDRMPNAGSANYPFYGYISDMRLHRHGMYTGDFTPPTEVTASTSEPVSSQATRFHLATNTANIVDKAQLTRLTLGGDTTASTAQTKYASSSIYLDGTGDYFDIIEDDGFNFGTGDFTIEFWMWPAAIGTENIILESRATHTDTGLLVMLNGGVIKTITGGVIVTTGTTTPTINSWYHVAVVRDSTSMRVYIDGTEESGSAAGNTSNITNPFGKFRVGTRFDVFNSFNGYIEDLRITKGLARYTANFTPPTGSLEG